MPWCDSSQIAPLEGADYATIFNAKLATNLMQICPK